MQTYSVFDNPSSKPYHREKAAFDQVYQTLTDQNQF